MKRYLPTALLLLLLLPLTALQTQAGPMRAIHDQPGAPPFRPGRILVKFRPETSPADKAEVLSSRDLPPIEEIPGLLVWMVSVAPGREQETATSLRQNPLVEFAEPDYVVHATKTPDDPYYPLQWGLPKIQAPEAWNEDTGGSNVVIAIIDTGVDLNHPDLNDKIVPGWDFVNGDSLAQDDHGHGTHVAGIAAAETNNARGVAGMSWGARIMPVKVLDRNGDGYYSDVAKGVRYACNHGAQVLNLSLGGPNPSSTLEEALDDVLQKGCLVMAAAGNGGQDAVDYPARYPETIAVAATDRNDARASFSDYGPEIDVAAPGVDIYSTLWAPANRHIYGWKAGTSMATPCVSGLAALIWSHCPDLTNDQIRSVIEATAKDLGDVGWDQYFGHGRIDAAAATHAASATPVLTVSANQLIFLADPTWGPQTQTILVGNDASCGWLTWTAGDDAMWLEENPTEGEASAPQPAEVQVSASKQGLAPGSEYYAEVTIDSSTLGVLEAPQSVEVTFIYSATPLNRTYFPLGASR
jgi:thermitase